MTASPTTHHASPPAHLEATKAAPVVHAASHQVHASVVAHPKHSAAKTSHVSSEKVAKLTHQQWANIHKITDIVSPISTLVPKSKKVTLDGTPVAGALTPAQVDGAYGVTALGIANQGQGQTIGIIDELVDTSILADTNVFSAQYGLPQFNVTGGPVLTVVKDTAFGPVDNAPTNYTAEETSLDVQWAHALAPKANILMVFVPVGNDIPTDFEYLLEGVQYAAAHGASVVSLSYGYHETVVTLPAIYQYNQAYLATGASTNIAVTVSSGDSSYPGFPSSSTNVISVGGTQLSVNANNTYRSESAWGSSNFNPYDGAGGGGSSAFFQRPAFQSTAGLNYGRYRTLPDVALNADPISAVSIYDSYDGYGWTAVGGTSEASPIFAGELAIAQEQRVAASKPLLTSVQINNAMYAAYKSPSYHTYFHDITSGNNSDNYDGYNGYTTTTGYDLATGLGSPIANTLLPFLANS